MGRVHVNLTMHPVSELTKETNSVVDISSKVEDIQKEEEVTSKSIEEDLQASTKDVEPLHTIREEINKSEEVLKEITGSAKDVLKEEIDVLHKEEHENTPPKIVEDVQNTINNIPIKRKTIRLASFLKQIIPEDELALVLHKWLKKSPEEIHAIFKKIDLETTEIKNWITKHENIKA